MTRPTRLTILGLLLLLASVAAALPLLLPPSTRTTPAAPWTTAGLTVLGAYHVHTTRSDGTGDLDAVAAAAARAGLQFVVITDHGDATRVPEPPRYRSGVLVIDAVEINTSAGHLIALGAAVSPYPLAGSARAVLEDVHRLGGMGIAAHPGSPRASLRWTAWEQPIDGVEWLNADSEWRDELLGSLGRLLLTYALRPAETLASILDRPADVMAQWDQATQTRRVIGLAGSDAHARLGFRQQSDPYEEGWHLQLPSYEASFRAFTTHVTLDAPLSGDPIRDAADVVDRLRWGRTYTVIDGLAAPGAFAFTATSGGRTARMGDYLAVAGEVVLHARVAAPRGSRLVVLRDGLTFFDTTEGETHVGVDTEPGVYRVEVYDPEARGRSAIPWLVSNPIYVGMRDRHERAQSTPAASPASARTSIATEAWVAEASAGSTSRLGPRAMTDGVAAIEWAYHLAGGRASGQFAAVRFPVEGLGGRDRLQIRARANQPMRLWIQVRSSRGAGERWGQSLYLDGDYQTREAFFADFAPLGQTSTPTPPLESIDALLLVVDTLNTAPGSQGQVRVAELWLAER